MCFSLSLCILLIALNQKPTWTFFATDIRWKLQKKRLSHAISGTFWETSAEPFFSQRYLDSPTPSPAMAVLAVDTNKRLSFWMKGSLSRPFLFTLSYPAILQMARARCHLEAAAGAMGDEGRRVWGAAFLAWAGIQSNERCRERRWRKKERLSQAIYLEE